MEYIANAYDRLFCCANVGWFSFMVSLIARRPRWSPNPLPDSIIEGTIDLQLLSHIGSSNTLLARYNEPHTPIFARKNHHIPHTTVLRDKPASKVKMVSNGLRTAIVKSYRIFNVFARNSADITNCTHQFLHAIATYLTRPCRVTSHGYGSICCCSGFWTE